MQFENANKCSHTLSLECVFCLTALFIRFKLVYSKTSEKKKSAVIVYDLMIKIRDTLKTSINISCALASDSILSHLELSQIYSTKLSEMNKDVAK